MNRRFFLVRIRLPLLLTLCILAGSVLPARAEGASLLSPPAVSAASAILIEAESGTVLYEKDAHQRRKQASTTKIMTALIALESGDPGRPVVIDERAVGVEGSSVYLIRGEILSMRDLIYALLLQSANDAAAAIAYEIGGSLPGFAALMNEKAEALSLHETHFVTPHGLDDDDHYTSAYDLACLTRAALENETFREIVSTQKKEIAGNRLLINHNRLLRSYPGATGVKTGFTKASGRCLVSSAEREGVTLIAVTLSAPDDWNDHTKLLDYGFSRVECRTLAAEGALRYTVPVVGGKDSSLLVVNPEPVTLVLPPDTELTVITELPRFVYGGIPEGKGIGRVVWLKDGIPAAEAPLVAAYPVKAVVYPTLWQRILAFLFPSYRLSA